MDFSADRAKQALSSDDPAEYALPVGCESFAIAENRLLSMLERTTAGRRMNA